MSVPDFVVGVCGHIIPPTSSEAIKVTVNLTLVLLINELGATAHASASGCVFVFDALVRGELATAL